jgi:hypothetical protein
MIDWITNTKPISLQIRKNKCSNKNISTTVVLKGFRVNLIRLDNSRDEGVNILVKDK